MREKWYFLLKNGELTKNMKDILKLIMTTLLGYILGLIVQDVRLFIILLIVFIFVMIIYIYAVSSKDHNFDILTILRTEEKNENWLEIIRFAYPLSRPLWLSGRNRLRIEIGEIVKNAACKIDCDISFLNTKVSAKRVLASTLIDDLGWTRYVNKQAKKAIENINEGIDIAKENKYADLVIKGCRHLLGIYTDLKMYTQYEECEEEISKQMENIKEDSKRKDINAGLCYSKAENLNNQGQYKEALVKAEVAQKIYLEIQDYERYVKTFDIIASIYKNMGHLKKAEHAIIKGIENAKIRQRKERHVTLVIAHFQLLGLRLETDEEFLLEEYFDIRNRCANIFQEAKNLLVEVNNENLLTNLKQEYKKVMHKLKKANK